MNRDELLNRYKAGERDFHEANLRRADLSEATLHEANLGGADLYRATLHGADLHGATLHGADLSWADLREADLRRADLAGAYLRWADLREANLRCADLRWADMREADLSRANLSKADLHGADMREANLSGCKGRLDAGEWLSDTFTADEQGLIVYKAFGDTNYAPPSHWNVTEGSVITEVCNPYPTENCACGVNFGTLAWCQNNYPHAEIRACILPPFVQVVVPYGTDGKARCAKLIVGKIVQEKGEGMR